MSNKNIPMRNKKHSNEESKYSKEKSKTFQRGIKHICDK